MELDREIALSVALERIMALENELIYAKAIAEQLKQQLDAFQQEKENKENNE